MRECSERDCLHLSHPFLSLSLLQLTTDELQTFVDAQFEELKRLVHVQEARNRHLVDLKEAFVTAAAAEQIAEITVETERLQEEMTSISQELSALNRAKMQADLAAAAAPGAVLPEGLRERLGQMDGRPVRSPVFVVFST